ATALVASTPSFVAWDNNQFPAVAVVRATASATAAFFTQQLGYRADPWAHAEALERSIQADLLRRFVGNPFGPTFRRETWLANVLELARAIQTESDCCFALSDALLEAGYPHLAQHFRMREHPANCWALQLIVGE